MARHSESPQGAGEPRQAAGFTLLELVFTVAVAAVLMVVGVPSFTSFLQNTRAAAHANDLVSALTLARSEAIRRGVAIAVCTSINGAACNGGNDWSVGWIVRTPGGEVLRAWPERSGGAGVVTGDVATIQYQPQGSAAGTALLRVRLPNCTGDQGRNVRVNPAGRVTVSRVNCI